ncbi:MAG: class I SAM-dependent methyltransferase [Candidatus Melainabacteria bacterium]|nr:class I SAM-dependent methyltransferase [Candidatus Melainabacteria bacterium]
MNKAVPINSIVGVELAATDTPGICKVVVKDQSARSGLSWDRFVRLKAASEAIAQNAGRETTILDVGGFDGALALFLPDYDIDLIDPATTGASLLPGPAGSLSYDAVTAIDALEHIAPQERERALQELASIARNLVVLNYPCRETTEAQKIVLEATDNPLVREHVEWELPDTNTVVALMQDLGFSTKVTPHASLAIWLGQYLTLNLAPAAAQKMNRYLIDHHFDEPFSTPLYHLVVCSRIL